MDEFWAGLTTVLDWIENVIINGLLGGGFQLLKEAFTAYAGVKPFLDAINEIIAMFAGA